MPLIILNEIENRAKKTRFPDFSSDKKYLIERVKEIIHQNKIVDLEASLENWEQEINAEPDVKNVFFGKGKENLKKGRENILAIANRVIEWVEKQVVEEVNPEPKQERGANFSASEESSTPPPPPLNP